MSHVSDFQVTEAMIVFGGGFVTSLGLLWRKGDDQNRAILKTAFARYWSDYSDPHMHARLAMMQDAWAADHRNEVLS